MSQSGARVSRQASAVLFLVSYLLVSSMAQASFFVDTGLPKAAISKAVEVDAQSSTVVALSHAAEGSVASTAVAGERMVTMWNSLEAAAASNNKRDCACVNCDCNRNTCPAILNPNIVLGLTYEATPFGSTVRSLSIMDTSFGANVDIYTMDGDQYSLFLEGKQFKYYPSLSHTGVSCLNIPNANARIDTKTGVVVVIICRKASGPCTVRYRTEVFANAAPPGTKVCKCSCCKGSGCSMTLLGSFPVTSCTNDCTPAQCASQFPASCPAPGTNGKTTTVCSLAASVLPSLAFVLLAAFVAVLAL